MLASHRGRSITIPGPHSLISAFVSAAFPINSALISLLPHQISPPFGLGTEAKILRIRAPGPTFRPPVEELDCVVMLDCPLVDENPVHPVDVVVVVSAESVVEAVKLRGTPTLGSSNSGGMGRDG